MENLSDQPNQMPVQENSNKPQKSKIKCSFKKKIIIIFSSIIAFVALLFIVIVVATSGAGKAGDEFIANIQDVKSEEVYLMLSDDMQNLYTEDEIESIVKQIGPILTGEPKQQSRYASTDTENGKTAEVIYEIKGSDKLTYTFTIDLIKEDNEWKVNQFNSEPKE